MAEAMVPVEDREPVPMMVVGAFILQSDEEQKLVLPFA